MVTLVVASQCLHLFPARPSCPSVGDMVWSLYCYHQGVALAMSIPCAGFLFAYLYNRPKDTDLSTHPVFGKAVTIVPTSSSTLFSTSLIHFPSHAVLPNTDGYFPFRRM